MMINNMLVTNMEKNSTDAGICPVPVPKRRRVGFPAPPSTPEVYRSPCPVSLPVTLINCSPTAPVS